MHEESSHKQPEIAAIQRMTVIKEKRPLVNDMGNLQDSAPTPPSDGALTARRLGKASR